MCNRYTNLQQCIKQKRETAKVSLMYSEPRVELQSRPLARYKKRETFAVSLRYSEPGSNRYGHYCPQDFKSGVSTYSTIRATQYPKRRGKGTILFSFYQTLSLRTYKLSIQLNQRRNDIQINPNWEFSFRNSTT